MDLGEDDEEEKKKKRRRAPILRAGGRTERKNEWGKKIPVGDISYTPTYLHVPTYLPRKINT